MCNCKTAVVEKMLFFADFLNYVFAAKNQNDFPYIYLLQIQKETEIETEMGGFNNCKISFLETIIETLLGTHLC